MREIKFRGWDGEKIQSQFIVGRPQAANCLSIMTNEEFAKTTYSLKEWKIMQFTGLHNKRNNRDVYESDIYFEEDAQDYGDRRIYFVITWISERCAFSMLEISEYHSYINNGFNAIERDFDGFYFEITQDSIDKMHYAGNVHQNPELL